MKKIITFIISFLAIMFHAQITMDYSVVSHIGSFQLQLKINIVNHSPNDYMIPFDKSGFKGYYESEYCGDFEDQDYPYKFFAPTVMLKEENKDDYLFPNSSRGHPPVGEGAEEYIQHLQEIVDNELNAIKDWKKKYSFKSYKSALENYYLTKNLLFLKPGERYTYEILLDLGSIARTSTSVLYDYYFFTFVKYDLSLHLCIKEDSYKWLTKHQKKEFKKYKTFKGIIKSNSYVFKAYD